MVKNRLRTVLMGLVSLVVLAFNSLALVQSDPWSISIQAGDRAMAQRQYVDAERAYREAARLSEKFKEKDPRTAVSFVKLAEVCSLQSKREEAEIFANRSLVALEKAMKESKPKDPSEGYYETETSAMIFEKAGAVFRTNGKYADAERVLKKLIETREKAAQVNKPPKGNDDYLKFLVQMTTNAQAKVADACDKLAEVYFVQRRFEDAESLYTKSLAARKAAFGEDKPPAALGLGNLATLYAAQGKFDKAEPLYAQAVRIFQQSGWIDRAEVAGIFENYSLLLRKTGREAEAAAMMEKAKAIRAKLQPSNR